MLTLPGPIRVVPSPGPNATTTSPPDSPLVSVSLRLHILSLTVRDTNPSFFTHFLGFDYDHAS